MGGIGGAIVLGALAVVAWRLRRKRNMDDGNDFGSGRYLDDKVTQEDSNNSSGMERYQSPHNAGTINGTINHAQNF